MLLLAVATPKVQSREFIPKVSPFRMVFFGRFLFSGFQNGIGSRLLLAEHAPGRRLMKGRRIDLDNKFIGIHAPGLFDHDLGLLGFVVGVSLELGQSGLHVNVRGIQLAGTQRGRNMLLQTRRIHVGSGDLFLLTFKYMVVVVFVVEAWRSCVIVAFLLSRFAPLLPRSFWRAGTATCHARA